MVQIIVRALSSLSLCFLLLGIATADAEDLRGFTAPRSSDATYTYQKNIGETVSVQARIIRASEEFKKGEFEGQSTKKRMRKIDVRIKDLKMKFRQFPFMKFQLVSEQLAQVVLKKKENLTLSDGHKIAVRPLYIEKGRIGMWLKWIDNDGMKVIDSRMHFEKGEPLLTAVETDDNESVILALSVVPVSS